MERRYLVAALAIVATFAVVSRGFRGLQEISFMHPRHLGPVTSALAMAKAGTMAKLECKAHSKAHTIQTHLRPRYPEEAQLLAEMNVPIAAIDLTIAEQMARQDEAIRHCARARAIQEAERARRDAISIQNRMNQASSYLNPISVKFAKDFERQVQEKAARASAHLAASNVKLQIAADKLQEMRFADTTVPEVNVTDGVDEVFVSPQVHCSVTTSQHAHSARSKVQYSYTSK